MTPLREDTKGVSQATLRGVRVLSEDTPSKKRKKRAQARNQCETGTSVFPARATTEA